jgi:7-cyano-7-deazaguanine synthase
MAQLLKKEDCLIFPLFVDYGQLAADAEWEACQKICEHLDLKPNRIDVSGFGHLIPSGLTNHNLDIEKNAFLPARNLLFLTVGAAYGYFKSANVVAIGLLSNPIFPDQTVEFVQMAQRAISKALGVDISILTPLISLDKCDILLLARKYGLPLSATYSCHSGNKEPCGHCISCKERIEAEKVLARRSR